jgi:hypothetical protein
MYVCMYVRAMQVCIYVSMCVYTYVYMYVCMYVYVHRYRIFCHCHISAELWCKQTYPHPKLNDYGDHDATTRDLIADTRAVNYPFDKVC